MKTNFEKFPESDSGEKNKSDHKLRENLAKLNERLEDIKPIRFGEIFDPEEELESVKSSAGKERKEKMTVYKEKLAYQKEGIAKIYNRVVEEIRKDSKISLSDLVEIIKQGVCEFGLTFSQEQVAMGIVSRCRYIHEKIHEIREKYPKNKDLFSALFGREPVGEIEVIEGPITLYFRCFDPRDYALIIRQDFVSQKAISGKDLEIAKSSAGASIGGCLHAGLENAIIVENTSNVSLSVQNSDSIHTHEEQHAIKKLFEEVSLEESGFAGILNCETDSERRLQFRRLFRFYREPIEWRAKDEILAYFKGSEAGGYILAELTTKEEDGGVYDYFTDRQSFYMGIVEEALGSEHKELIQEVLKEVFEDEYFDLLAKGIGSLEYMVKSGYSREKVLAIFTNEPLKKWRKVAIRLLKENKKMNTKETKLLREFLKSVGK